MRSAWLLVFAGCGFESSIDSNPDTATCADGVVDPGESCDDANLAGGDGCSAACEIEPNFVCPSGLSCRPVLGLAIGSATTLQRFGGGGGTPFMRDCKANELAAGFEGWFGNAGSWIGRTRAACATVALGTNGHAITTTTTPTNWAGNDDQVSSAIHVCNADEVITGVKIGVDSTPQNFTATTGFRVVCEQVVHLDGKLQFVSPRELELHGPGGGTFTLVSCPEGVITGFYGSSGAVLDAVALRCATLTARTE